MLKMNNKKVIYIGYFIFVSSLVIGSYFTYTYKDTWIEVPSEVLTICHSVVGFILMLLGVIGVFDDR